MKYARLILIVLILLAVVGLLWLLGFLPALPLWIILLKGNHFFGVAGVGRRGVTCAPMLVMLLGIVTLVRSEF
jgi:hypothetical protein